MNNAGIVETDMSKRAAGDNRQVLETFKSMTPIGRIADPAEIANYCLTRRLLS
ncbi:MAG: hypothetical protein WA941_20360 [Nitrososphaeraceae archaeon]